MKSFKKCFFVNKSCKKRVRQNKNPLFKRVFWMFGGEGGIRTLAALRTLYSLSRGAPSAILGYFSSWSFLFPFYRRHISVNSCQRELLYPIFLRFATGKPNIFTRWGFFRMVIVSVYSSFLPKSCRSPWYRRIPAGIHIAGTHCFPPVHSTRRFECNKSVHFQSLKK